MDNRLIFLCHRYSVEHRGDRDVMVSRPNRYGLFKPEVLSQVNPRRMASKVSTWAYALK
jgi:hypothetical protein